MNITIKLNTKGLDSNSMNILYEKIEQLKTDKKLSSITSKLLTQYILYTQDNNLDMNDYTVVSFFNGLDIHVFEDADF